MGPPGVIVVYVGLKHAAQMLLIKHNDIVETLTPDAPNDPLAVRIGPGTAGRNLYVCIAQVADSVLERGAVDGIPVPQQVAWRGVPRKRRDDLLGSPLGGWMFGNVKMHDAAAVVSQHVEDKEHAEVNR